MLGGLLCRIDYVTFIVPELTVAYMYYFGNPGCVLLHDN
jgi:hypothetical protein